LHSRSRRRHLRTRAACVVANPRNSYGYCCGLRLAAHPDPQRQLTAQVMQRFLKITMNFRETIKNQIGYKPFIDGLRAVAILAVVAYHIGFKQTPGGFVGVDVFFVISGYLICTQMIWFAFQWKF